MAELIRILVVDDSALFAQAISEVLDEDPLLCVVGTASDGRQAIEMTRSLRPTLITMDIHMPGMGGLDAITEIMASFPTPILVMTSDPSAEGHDLYFDALRRGALDIMRKPAGWDSATQREALREHVKFLASVPVVRHVEGHRYRWRARSQTSELAEVTPGDQITNRIVGVVASTGGPAALAQILEALPLDFPACIVVVQHIGVGFVSDLAGWLDKVSPLNVVVANDETSLVDGRVLVAPDDHHVILRPGSRVALTSAPAVDGHRPSGTLMLSSMAEVYGRRSIGVVLTGMGRDGVDGLHDVRAAGGRTISQDETSSTVYGMPRVAWEVGASEKALPPDEIADLLVRLTREPSNEGS